MSISPNISLFDITIKEFPLTLIGIAVLVLVAYCAYKMGAGAIKWLLLLAAVVIGYWFFTYGGGVDIKTPDLPKIPSSKK